MKWFIVALLYWTPELDVKPHIMINTKYIFNSYEECQENMIQKSQELQSGVENKYPNVVQFSMKCVNYEEAVQLLNLHNHTESL